MMKVCQILTIIFSFNFIYNKLHIYILDALSELAKANVDAIDDFSEATRESMDVTLNFASKITDVLRAIYEGI